MFLLMNNSISVEFVVENKGWECCKMDEILLMRRTTKTFFTVHFPWKVRRPTQDYAVSIKHLEVHWDKSKVDEHRNRPHLKKLLLEKGHKPINQVNSYRYVHLHNVNVIILKLLDHIVRISAVRNHRKCQKQRIGKRSKDKLTARYSGEKDMKLIDSQPDRRVTSCPLRQLQFQAYIWPTPSHTCMNVSKNILADSLSRTRSESWGQRGPRHKMSSSAIASCPIHSWVNQLSVIQVLFKEKAHTFVMNHQFFGKSHRQRCTFEIARQQLKRTQMKEIQNNLSAHKTDPVTAFVRRGLAFNALDIEKDELDFTYTLSSQPLVLPSVPRKHSFLWFLI